MLTIAGCADTDLAPPDDSARVRDAAEAQWVVDTIATGLVRNLLTSVRGPGVASAPVVGQTVTGESGEAVVWGYPRLLEVHGFDWYTTTLDAVVTIDFHDYRVAGSLLAVTGRITCDWHSVEATDSTGTTTTGRVSLTTEDLSIEWIGDDPLLDRIQFQAHNVADTIDRYTGALTNAIGSTIPF